MDIVLGRYAQAHLEQMSGDDLSAFERFLALPDPVLTNWFTGGDATAEAGEFAALVAALRAHHGLTPAGGNRLETQ